MQCTDIFFLDVDICQLGIDQRKVNMLAIEMAEQSRDKPIIVSHGMISGLV
jgi:tyrosyl-tRNA synthetase